MPGRKAGQGQVDPTHAEQQPADVPAPAPSAGVYGISVAAELGGCGVQALRLYERRGLLEPVRTPGGTRRYSQNDLVRLRRITALIDAGLNLAGVAEVLALEAENARLRAALSELEPGRTPS